MQGASVGSLHLDMGPRKLPRSWCRPGASKRQSATRADDVAVAAEGVPSELVSARSFREAKLELGGSRAAGSLDLGACMVELVWLFGRSRERGREGLCRGHGRSWDGAVELRKQGAEAVGMESEASEVVSRELTVGSRGRSWDGAVGLRKQGAEADVGMRPRAEADGKRPSEGKRLGSRLCQGPPRDHRQ